RHPVQEGQARPKGADRRVDGYADSRGRVDGQGKRRRREWGGFGPFERGMGVDHPAVGSACDPRKRNSRAASSVSGRYFKGRLHYFILALDFTLQLRCLTWHERIMYLGPRCML